MVAEKSNKKCQNCSKESQSKNSVNCSPDLVLPDNSGTQFLEESCKEDNNDKSLALVPIQANKALSKSNSNVSKHGWLLLRRLFLPKWQHSEKPHAKKMCVVKRVLKLPSRNSSSVVHPDQKQSISNVDEDKCSNLEGENCAIVPMGPKVAWSPISPCHGSNGLPEELRDLHEKYSSSCRLFSYEELVLATSNFIPGLSSLANFHVANFDLSTILFIFSLICFGIVIFREYGRQRW